MSLRIEPLRTLDELRSAERLQSAVLGERSRCVEHVPALITIAEAGGLVLGAWGGPSQDLLIGLLVDHLAQFGDYRARLTSQLLVSPSFRGQGAALALRLEERRHCLRDGARERVDVIFWWSDPLRSDALHVSLNRLGAIGTKHAADAVGPLQDHLNAGLPTDRLRVEWWVDAPRTHGAIGGQFQSPVRSIGLDRMQVVNRSRSREDGTRSPAGVSMTELGNYVLVEIPIDLDLLRERAPDDALHWRLQNREVYDVLFGQGFTMVGLIHEGRRSFQLLERVDRGTVLGRGTEASR